MLIPDRKKALGKIRDTVAEILADSAGNDKLQGQAAWIAMALNQLLFLEDRDYYLRHYREGRTLAEEGAKRCALPAVAERLATLPVEHHPSVDMEAIRLSTAGILQCLAQITRALRSDPTAAQYLDKVIDWENALYLRLDPPPTPATTVPLLNAETLQSYLRRKLPERKNLVVTALKPLYGGFSKQTTLFSMRDDVHGEQPLVMRAEKKSKLVYLGGTDITREFTCVRYLHKKGLPVAEPLWVEPDADIFGTRFMVSRQVPGKAVGIGIADMGSLPKATQVSLLTTLAKIHQTPIDASDADFAASNLADWIAYPTLQDNTRAWVIYWKEQLDRAGCPSTPLVERVCGWLIDNVPREEIRPAVVHGDYGLANILIDGDQVGTVLDWELSYFGDPAYDFTNFMHRYDRSLLDLYEQAGGQRISEYRFFYYLMFRVMKSVPEIIGLSEIDVNPNAHVNFYLLSSFIHHMTTPLNEMLEKARSLKNEI